MAGVGALRETLWAAPAARELLWHAGTSPDDLDDTADLAACPTTDRAFVGARWADLIAIPPGDVRWSDLAISHSSGTTGLPIRVPRCRVDRATRWAFVRQVSAERGVTLPARPHVVTWCALPGRREGRGEVAEGTWTRIAVAGDDAIARAERERPDVVSTDALGLSTLAVVPKVVVSSATQLSRRARLEAEDRLGCPVIDVYGLTETGPVAVSCPVDAAWHLVDGVHVEVLDGEVVVTRLRVGALAVLRYRTGDRGVLGVCACGRPSLVGFVGRASTLVS